jgi:hypothetical protein
VSQVMITPFWIVLLILVIVVISGYYTIKYLLRQRRELRCQLDEKDAEIKNMTGEIMGLRREMAGLDQRNERLVTEVIDGQKAVTVLLSVREQRSVETPLFDDTLALARTGILAVIEDNREHPERRRPRPVRPPRSVRSNGNRRDETGVETA